MGGGIELQEINECMSHLLIMSEIGGTMSEMNNFRENSYYCTSDRIDVKKKGISVPKFVL